VSKQGLFLKKGGSNMTTTGTCASEIYDIFMMTVTDYRLTALYTQSQVDFESFLEAWLRMAIVEFIICDQPLVYSQDTQTFTEVLNDTNKMVLAMLMMKYWLKKEVADITQFRLHVQDRDYKMNNEANNLKEKNAYLLTVMEASSQMLNDYGYKRADWNSWLNQDFYNGD
jgi:hypothetical protein